MPSKRKFHKTVFQIEVLSEEPLPGENSLDDIHYEITHGHSSGIVKEISRTEIDGPTAAQELIKQGSDPEFFRLNESGEDIEE